MRSRCLSDLRMNNVSLTVLPDCQRRTEGGVCRYISDAYNLGYRPAPAVCNYFCHKRYGPEGEGHHDRIRFLKEVGRRSLYGMLDKCHQRHPLVYSYDGEQEARYAHIRAFAEANGYDVMIGGSAIIKGIEARDLDIVLRSSEPWTLHDRFLLDPPEGMTADELRRDGLDVFVTDTSSALLYPSIDFETRTLYVARWYRDYYGVRHDETIRGVEVVRHPLDAFMPEFVRDATSKRRACCGGKRKGGDSRRKATSKPKGAGDFVP